MYASSALIDDSLVHIYVVKLFIPEHCRLSAQHLSFHIYDPESATAFGEFRSSFTSHQDERSLLINGALSISIRWRCTISTCESQEL